MKPRIFIDGEHGTTGLQIRARLAGRDDIELTSIPEAERRNADLREEMLHAADIAIPTGRQHFDAADRYQHRVSHRRRVGLRLCGT